VWPETRTGVWVWDGLPPAAPVPLPDGGREGEGPEGDHQDHHPAGERGQGRGEGGRYPSGGVSNGKAESPPR